MREKVRELLKKVATVASTVGSAQLNQESGAAGSSQPATANFESEKRLLEQGHQIELVR